MSSLAGYGGGLALRNCTVCEDEIRSVEGPDARGDSTRWVDERDLKSFPGNRQSHC